MYLFQGKQPISKVMTPLLEIEGAGVWNYVYETAPYLHGIKKELKIRNVMLY